MAHTRMSNTVAIIEEWINQSERLQALWLENGPTFKGHYDECAESMGIEAIKVAPYFLDSNEWVENAVRQANKLMLKCNTTGENYNHRLCAWNDSPRADGLAIPPNIFQKRQVRVTN